MFGADINKDGKLQAHDFELARDVSSALISVVRFCTKYLATGGIGAEVGF